MIASLLPPRGPGHTFPPVSERLVSPATSTTYLVGGMSVEKRSISVSASKTAFIPRELSTCLQNLQHRVDTHRSLKLQLLVAMASREG